MSLSTLLLVIGVLVIGFVLGYAVGRFNKKGSSDNTGSMPKTVDFVKLFRLDWFPHFSDVAKIYKSLGSVDWKISPKAKVFVETMELPEVFGSFSLAIVTPQALGFTRRVSIEEIRQRLLFVGLAECSAFQALLPALYGAELKKLVKVVMNPFPLSGDILIIGLENMFLLTVEVSSSTAFGLDDYLLVRVL